MPHLLKTLSLLLLIITTVTTAQLQPPGTPPPTTQSSENEKPTAKLMSKSKSIPITYETDFWYDLSKLKIKKKMGNFTKLCVQGIWLLYDNKDFQGRTKQEVGVVSGDDTCVDLKNYGHLGSIQRVSPSRTPPTLAFFPERNFNGPVWAMDQSNGPLPPTPSTSLIIYGPEEWTLHPLGSPSPICLSPQGGKSLRLPICFISKLIDGKNIKSGSFYKIKLGCDSKTKKINIHFCMDYFNGKSTRVLDVAHALQGRGIEEEEDSTSTFLPTAPITTPPTSCPPTVPSLLTDKEIKTLMETRLNPRFPGENYIWPRSPDSIWTCWRTFSSSR
ncbi:uncharacterized protein LOC110843404 [Folsomia candida]|uniref:uncharacterized protein LOC110843404 n=1 Tax=Folsomia candida TaxID=158441 RepID=UPI001605314F|nr:uncharacterized protein LOC110843404 [Folsomia candida]